MIATFNANRYADQLMSDFYAIFRLEPSGNNVVTSADILEKRDAIVSWNQNLNADLKVASAEAIHILYETLKAKIVSGSIGSFDIGFERNGDEEPVQDRHPLLRAVDFAAHSKRSVQAYCEKDVGWLDLQHSNTRMKEFGDEYEYGSNKPLITHLFLNVENQGYYAGNHLPIEDALAQAVQYEKDVEANAIDLAQLVQNPEILTECFQSIVGEYENYMGSVGVDVPALMKWEKIADNALQALSLPDLQSVYNHFTEQEGYSSVRRVIIKELESVCMVKPELQKHLEYGVVMDETDCDIRVQHLVANYGRYPANINEAFSKAIVSLQKFERSNGPASIS